MMTLTVMITGLAMGLTVYVGEKIGAGRRDEAGEVIGSGISLFSMISAVLTVIMVLASSALARVMHAPVEAFDNTVLYVAICSGGTLFIVAYI